MINKKYIKIIISCVAAAIAIGSALAIVHYMNESKENERMNEELKGSLEAIDPEKPIEEIEKKNTGVSNPIELVPEEKKTLDEMNSDYIGWIDIPGTIIDYPVVQTKDNQFYLDHDFNKDKSPYGTAFLDYQAKIYESQNLVIYAHNMSDGQMFTDLTKFENEEFFKENSVINFRNKVYDIFSVNKVNVNRDVGKVIQYTNPDYYDQEYFLNWINEMSQDSLVVSNIKIVENDRILTLSTCSYEDKNDRFVVFAKERSEE